LWRGGKPAQARRPRGTPATSRDADLEPRRPACADGGEKGEDGGDVKFTVATSFEEIEQLKEEWDKLVGECEGDVYMTFDWCRIWWKYYGAKRRLQLLLFHSGGRLAGIVPMFTETVWLGLIWLKVAKIIGSDFGLQVCSLLVRPEFLNFALTSSMEHFCGKCGCDAVILGPLSQTKRSTKEVCGWISSHRHSTFRVVERYGEMQSAFSLPGTFEDYLKQIGKNERHNYKRHCNVLAKSFRFTWDVLTTEASVEKEFASFIAMHQAQWQAEGKMGHFVDWPLASEFNAELARVMAAKGRMRLYRLLLDDKPVSYQYSFVFNQFLYWRLCSRLHEEEWKRHRLGGMGQFKMIEAAITEGVREIEAGRGHYEYKTNSGASETQLLSLAFLRRSFSSPVRFKAFLACAKALHLIYYKIIIRRVYPRLQFLRRPLARVWIRSQF
jgi:CelD/BcsL family acetyltransferase involved in cellulose biosynthesis